MENITSTPNDDLLAITEATRALEYYDKHPTTVPELFINQATLRRLVQMGNELMRARERIYMAGWALCSARSEANIITPLWKSEKLKASLDQAIKDLASPEWTGGIK